MKSEIRERGTQKVILEFAKNMRRLTRKIAFNLGFWSTVGLLGIANFLSYPMSHSFRLSPKIGFLDDGYARGFPFAFYFVWGPEVRLVGFDAVVNLLIALICGLVVGLVFRSWAAKPTSRLP